MHNRSWGATGLILAVLASGLVSPPAAVAEESNRTTRVSVTAAGAQVAGESRNPAASSDGTYVAFASTSPLTTSDTNGVLDVYRKNTVTGAVDLVSVATLGSAAGNGPSGNGNVGISADGRYVAFESTATDLTILEPSNTTPDVYVRDLTTGDTQRVNVNTDGTPPTTGNGAGFAAMAANGQRIAFFSRDGLRLASGVNPGAGVYVRDLGGGLVPSVTLFAGNTTAGEAGVEGQVSISDDGNVVAYLQAAPDRIVRRDLRTGQATTLHTGTAPAALIGPDALNADGTHAAFWSEGDVFVATITATGVNVTLASVHHDGGPVDAAGANGAMSGDGRYVVFTTAAAALLKDRQSGLLSVVGPLPVDATITPNGRVPLFSSSAADLVAGDTNGAVDVFAYARDTAAVPFDVRLVALDPVTPPGAFAVPTRRLPASAVPLPAIDLVQGTSIDAIDLGAAPLRSIPLRSIPLRSIPLRSIPLRSILLSEVRLSGTTWDAILASLDPNPFAGVPLQAITLDQVLAADPPALRTLPLRSIDLSATPLRSISLASIAMGATPLRSIPLPGGQAWCDLLADLGFACDVHEFTEDSPILALDLAGVPLRSIPLRSIPLRSIDLSAAPLRSIPLGDLHLEGVALGGLPIASLSTHSDIVDCQSVDCDNGTLADADRADAFRPGATLGALFDAVAADDLPGSLAELLLALVDPADYPWEQVPVGDVPMAEHADAPAEVRYEVTFSAAGDEAADAMARVRLPAGFRYVAGSAAPLADPTVDGDALVFALGPVSGGSTGNALRFRAYPDLVLGGERAASAEVLLGNVGASALEQALVRIVDANESGAANDNDPATAPVVQSDTVYLSHIGQAGDVDYYRFPVPARGTTVVFRLGNQTAGADIDMAVYNPAAAQPVRSVPLRSIPLRSIPMSDEGVDVQAATQPLSTELQDDVIRLADVPLRAASQNRGANDEQIAFVSDADPGAGREYIVQVTGYNGDHRPNPYVLYVREIAPEAPPACPTPRVLPRAGEGVPGTAPAPATLPADLNTVVLVAQERLGDTYGAAAAADVVNALSSLTARRDLGVVGTVWPVESSAVVDRALDAWDADPCSPGRANDAFRAVADIVDQVRAARPTLRNVVVAGGDDMIPMARLSDNTKLANEATYVDEARNGDSTQNGTPLTAAMAASRILSDDPLGDIDPIPWLDHELYVPDLAVGRLVESPADIVAQVQQFIAADGVLDPSTALTTGYDFLSDGAEAVHAGLGKPGQKLINDTWTRADEEAALYPAGAEAPMVAALNAHYDHSRSLPGSGNSTGDESDLFTTADVDAHPGALPRRILFTMGCHAGLNVPDAYMTSSAAAGSDWAQAFARNGAAVYLANTGYGYGDTATVAYSEELMRLFAERLDGSLTVGQAAMYAKQAYFGALGAYGPYDEKVVQQAAFYGLPMYRVAGTGTAPPAPTGLATAPDANGVQSAGLTVTPQFTKHSSPAGGQFFSVDGEVQLMQYRPIEPRTSRDVTPVDRSLVAHGILLTELSSTDQPIVPAVARPVVDLSANEPPPPAGDVAFPASLHTLTAFNTPSGEQQRAVFLPGQFFRDSEWTGAGGLQRLFDRIGAEVKYSTSNDFTAPYISNVVSELSGGVLTMRLTATDAVRVLVLVKDESGQWRPVELQPTAPGSTAYVGTLADVQGTRVEWFAQAMDAVGNVGATSNKARYFGARTNTAPLDFALTPQQPNGSNGWFVDPVTVAIPGQPGVSYTLTVNDGAPMPYTGPVQLASDRVHVVQADGSDGSTGAGIVPIDQAAPSMTSALSQSPNDKGWFNEPVVVSFSCDDPVSQVRTCGPGATVEEGVDQHVTGVAVDYAGNQRSVTVGPIDVDLTAPHVQIDGVVDGQSYDAGNAPTPTCFAFDGLSGLDGSCSLVVTGSPDGGHYTAVATAADNAGNVTTTSVTWFVTFRFGGFLDPINDTGSSITSQTSVFKAGSTIPVKFEILDDAGNPVQVSTPPQWLTPLRGPALGSAPVNESPTRLSPTSGSNFDFDPRASRYQFNWQPTKDMAGYYWRIGARLDDGSVHIVYVGVK